jgi:CHAT domain-containing protein/Flp pilus assembly protein TadD
LKGGFGGMADLKLEDASADDLLKQGQALFEQEDYEGAIGCYERAIVITPNNAEVWFNHGKAMYGLERYEEALASYDQVIQFKPENYVASLYRGIVLSNLSRYKEALASYNQAIQVKPNNYVIFLLQGNALHDLGCYTEAITIYNKAIDLKANFHEALSSRGLSLNALGCYEEALASYDRAIQFNLEISEDDKTWCNRGDTLKNLGRNEEAVASYNQAIAINPNIVEALTGRGNALKNLGRYEEALANYDQALQFKLDDEVAWYNRGSVLENLGRYEEALVSYDQTIQVKPDFEGAWLHQGNVLNVLGRYEEAIISYDQIIQIKPDFEDAWYNQGITLAILGRYDKAIANYDEALRLTQNQLWQAWEARGTSIFFTQGLHSALAAWDEGLSALFPTTPDYQYACGALHRRKGRTQYQEGSEHPNPFPDWDSARKSYLKTLEFWTFENPNFTQLHLEVLQELSTVCTYLFSPQELKALLEEATAKLQRILQNRELTLGQKITLETKFAGFNQLQVTNLAQQNSTQALELAEARKNRCLSCLRDGWHHKPPEPNYAQIQTLLKSGTAIIYWHLSPAALTTFILTPGQPPEVFQPKSPATAKQLQEFEEWMKQWKQSYQQHRDLDPEAMQTSPWRKNMEFMLYNRLRSILDINNLCQSHLKNIDQLILIPHRDLHLLPLHALFPGRFAITYLPSAQLGLDLQSRESKVGDRILCVQDPTSAPNSNEKKNNDPLKWAKREVDSILSFYSKAQPSLIAGTAATKTALEASLGTNYDCLHFTGHGGHDIESPLNSALPLADNDKLTLKDIFQLNLQNYSLVCLSACETGITSSQEIIDEYIGLVSGFLSAGAAHVISTLWPVEDESSALLMIQFHRLLQQKNLSPAQALTPAQALAQAQEWLRTITYKDLSNWYQSLANELDTIEPGCTRAEDFGSLARKAQQKFQDNGLTTPPYEHPYHWAGFTVTGKVPGG